jgi:hypothetical protein
MMRFASGEGITGITDFGERVVYIVLRSGDVTFSRNSLTRRCGATLSRDAGEGTKKFPSPTSWWEGHGWG